MCMTVSRVLTVFSPPNSSPPALAESDICGYHQTSDKNAGKGEPPLRTNMDRMDGWMEGLMDRRTDVVDYRWMNVDQSRPDLLYLFGQHSPTGQFFLLLISVLEHSAYSRL